MQRGGFSYHKRDIALHDYHSILHAFFTGLFSAFSSGIVIVGQHSVLRSTVIGSYVSFFSKSDFPFPRQDAISLWRYSRLKPGAYLEQVKKTTISLGLHLSQGDYHL